MMNIVMLVRNRSELTRQCMDTLCKHTIGRWNLTVIDDGSTDYLTEAAYVNRISDGFPILSVKISPACEVTGRLRNLGVYFSEKQWGRGEWLYLSDNDACFTPGWDLKLVKAMEGCEHRFKLIGPYRHPYHLPNGVVMPAGEGYDVVSTDAVQGLGHLMRWETWDTYGPLDAHAKGTNQSEDFKFCQDIIKAGWLVGSIQPEVVHNCGLTGTSGKASPGAEVMGRIKGVLMK
jgi:hypothetical protein